MTHLWKLGKYAEAKVGPGNVTLFGESVSGKIIIPNRLKT